jgi:hypothetical protein
MRKALAVIGIILFATGVVLGVSLLVGALLAASLDETQTAHAAISFEGPPFCEWEASLSARVMTQNTSQAILVKVRNPAETACESTLALRAPTFDISPAREEQKITLAAGSSGSLSWILTPRRTGVFQIAVSDVLNTQILGITVKDEYGLTAVQAKLLAFVGTLFGPMLTVPWWLDRLRMLKPKREPTQAAKQE